MTPFALALLVAAAPAVPADLILHNGKIWTGNPAAPEASAVALWRGRILTIGADADVMAFAGAGTKVIDLTGRRAVPGFTDAHVHLLGGGRSLAQVDLKDAADEAEFGKRLREWDQKTPRDRWLLGGNWDHERAFAGVLPTATIVDKYVPNRPVFIRRYDGHMALANTAALKLAGVTTATKDPAGGVVFKLPSGEPSGVLKDNAMDMVDRLIPEPAADEIAEAVRAAGLAFAKHGVTGVTDMEGSGPAARRALFQVLQKLDRAGQLTVRVDLRWPIAGVRDVINVGAGAGFGSDYLQIDGVKGFMDGSLGSSTAKMFDPYEKEPANTGVFVTPPDQMRILVKAADAAGLNVAIHAIGDRANADLLDIYESTGNRDRRFRVEHAQHLRPADYTRFKALGVVASMQPFHVIDDGRWAEGRIGAARCRSSYAYRGLLDAGAVLAFGSDWPVAPLNVLEGIDAAVNRRTLGGKHPAGWFPEQRITVAEAVQAYTAGSAYAANRDGDRGTLAAGKLADIVVLSTDIFAPANRDAIAAAKVDLTVVGGKVVFDGAARR